MSRIIKTAFLAAAAAAALGTGSAHADPLPNPICVEDTPLDPVYHGCTWYDLTQPCVYGGGEILGDPYRLICP